MQVAHKLTYDLAWTSLPLPLLLSVPLLPLHLLLLKSCPLSLLPLMLLSLPVVVRLLFHALPFLLLLSLVRLGWLLHRGGVGCQEL